MLQLAVGDPKSAAGTKDGPRSGWWSGKWPRLPVIPRDPEKSGEVRESESGQKRMEAPNPMEECADGLKQKKCCAFFQISSSHG